MPLYESVFIARQDISASQVEGLADQFSKILEEGGGSVAKREYWGLRSLAFKIKKNRKGHYTLFNSDAPTAAVQETSSASVRSLNQASMHVLPSASRNLDVPAGVG